MKRFISFIVFISLGLVAFATGHDATGATIAGFAPVGTYVCQRLQTDLEAYYGKNLAKFRTLGSTALIKWLLSPQNRSGFQQINVESIPGKKRGVAFKVDAPYCYELCRLDVDCTNEDIVYADPETKEMTFDLTEDPFRHCDDEGNPVLLRFTEEDMMKYCTTSDTAWMQEQIFRYLLRFEEALDKALSVALNTVIGTNANAESITDIPLFTSGNTFTPNLSVLNPEGMWYINQIYNDIGNEGQFALIGGTIMNKLIQFNKWTGLNAAGVDMSKADPINPYPFYDRNFNTVFGQSDLILLYPGPVQLVTWNKYKGEKRRAVTNLYTKSTVVLPNTGLEVDYKWKYDPDCEIFTFEAFLHAILAANPAGGCGVNMEGVNGILRIHDCGAQPIIPACADQASSGSA
jgi:hypothetical protein